MRDIITGKLLRYIRENNPDLVLSLQGENSVGAYLVQKVNSLDNLIEQLQTVGTPAYIIEETCMEELTTDLRPSKYNFISNILEEDFEFAFQQLQRNGILLYEIVNLIQKCAEAFETFGFTEDNEDNRQLRYTVTGIIDKYLSK